MKKTALIMALVFSSLVANAITVDNLLKSYRNQPDIQYEAIKGKELKALVDSVPIDTEKEILRMAKKLVVLGFPSGPEQQKGLSSRLQELDNYSLALSYAMETPTSANALLSTLTESNGPLSVDIYSRNSSSNEYLDRPLFLISVPERTALVFLDGKIKPDAAKDLVRTAFNTRYTDILSGANMGKTRSALDRINLQRSIYPQEKIHVVTDRDLYCGGDTIWLRAFVVDADTHVPTAISKYAYVELLSPFGFADKRVKLMERDGVYAGYIPVDEDIYEGDYTLAAYTAYSENQGKDYFFRKPLSILAPQSSKYAIDSDFTPVGDSEVKGSFKIRALNDSPINYKVMSWTMPDGKTFELPHAKQGFSRNFSKGKDENIVLVKFGDYGKYVPVKYPAGETDIAFYPEGGWLIADEPCTVAFKATDENGKGADASGVIRNDKGEETAKFNTAHNGMGSVTFIPETGRNYYAEYTGNDGKQRSALIGTPKDGAAALRYRSTSAKGTFSVAGGEGQDLELVVALRGAGMLSAPISSATPLSFEKNEMPEGLYQAFLVSKKDNTVLSERIFFIRQPLESPEISSLNPDSTSISLMMPKGTAGDCTVRITNGTIPAPTGDFDVRSQLMLQSELRGRIENPAYYFSANDRETEQNLDLLMMVNGWSRYNLPAAMQGKYEEPTIPLEIGQEISGQVRSRWNNSPMEGVLVSAIVPKWNFGTFADTDKDGVFHLNGFDFPENTPFILKAMNEKGGLEANYDIFEDQFPAIEPLKTDPPVRNTDEIADFFKSARWIMLDEVKVQAFRQSNDDIYADFASFSKTADDMKASGINSIEGALRGIGGISNVMNHLKWRNQEVSYYIDGQLFDPQGTASQMYDAVGHRYGGPFGPTGQRKERSGLYGPTLSDVETAVPFNSIARIDFVRPEHSYVLGPSYGGAVVVITTKAGEKDNWDRQFDLKDHLPLGYQQYKEYASPMLSVDADDYDLQTHPTLLWLPSVRFDESGRSIDLKFPVKSNYRVIIEGLSDDGTIISETL